MGRPRAGALGTRWWFGALVAVSAVLLLVTIASYAFVDQRLLARILFWLGLGGENNIGSWWSGMLLALAAFLAFDGLFASCKPRAEQRGWLALGFALLLLSFDEIASLHEYLKGRGLGYLAALGVFGLALASYGMEELRRARVPAHTLILLLVAFGLFASVGLQEELQNRLTWSNPVVYGLRAFVEEGTELVAMLIFVSVMRANSVSLRRASQDWLIVLARSRGLVASTASLLWPLMVAATFVLPRPGGPADWLTSTLFLACALLAVRASIIRDALDSQYLALISFYLVASAAANAVSFAWNPLVLGTAVNLRGIVFALLVVGAAAVFRAAGRAVQSPLAWLAATAIATAAVVWPSSQVLWCALPPALALWAYVVESKVAVPAESIAAALQVVPELPADPRRSPSLIQNETRSGTATLPGPH